MAAPRQLGGGGEFPEEAGQRRHACQRKQCQCKPGRAPGLAAAEPRQARESGGPGRRLADRAQHNGRRGGGDHIRAQQEKARCQSLAEVGGQRCRHPTQLGRAQPGDQLPGPPGRQGGQPAAGDGKGRRAQQIGRPACPDAGQRGQHLEGDEGGRPRPHRRQQARTQR